MALARALARDLTVTQYLMGFTSWRLSLSALQHRFNSEFNTAEEEESKIPVETDGNILKAEVCGTDLFVERRNNIKLKPDSEYPDWLWKLHLGKPLEPHELDPNTKEYWECVYKLGKLREAKLKTIIICKRDQK